MNYESSIKLLSISMTVFASPVHYVIVLWSINGLFWSSVISLVRDYSSSAYSADMYQCPRCGVAFEKPSFSKLMASGITCPNCKASLEIDTGFVRLKLTAAVVVLVAGTVNFIGVLNPIASKALTLVVAIITIVSAVVVIWENTNPRLRIRKKSMSQVQLNLNRPPQ
jgi:DNA-directed RNA polymerase subunit RPC12/RpoP